MKKRINRMLVLIAVLAICLTMFLVTIAYYGIFRRQVTEDLRDATLVLVEYDDMEEMRQIGAVMEQNGMRLTLIAADGQVILDNEADYTQMGNHGSRPEIAEALASGQGQAVRHSETLAKSTFYYAVRLEDGSVLRVAKDVGSIYSVFWRVLPGVIVLLFFLTTLCLIIAHFLTGKLVAPVEKLAENLDEYNDVTDYEELTPFVNMIREHHQDIMKNAKMRQEFTANVSHELKTPLTSISGYAELIETGMASEEDTVRFAHGIRSSANRLLTLINDIIRLSELDSTEQEVLFEKLNLYQLAFACAEMLTMSADKHQVTISMSGEKESYIWGNKQMIEELLYNLCDNAIRYNNAGGRVDVQVFPGNGGTQLIVKDTGIGIPREHQERIFERFYRVDKSRSKSTGGTGLGLAIVKHIVAKHNASMELNSEPGKGTAVKVTFPGC